MCDLRGLSKYEVNQYYFEFIRNAAKEEYEKYGWNRKRGMGLYKCRKCGKLHYFRNYYFKTRLRVCDNKCNGVKYGNNKVIYGFNDLATTHPELVKYFQNPEDAKKYTYGSKQKVLLKCLECGKVKETTLDILSHQGFSCNYCSDGISYPEKIISLILSELNIVFTKQFKFERFNYRYDFYLPKYNIIIEVHGRQHYENSKWKTYDEEHKNDLFKYDLAILNEYEYNKNFFIIDAKESDIAYLRNNIEQCEFFKQFDLNNIDWNKIDKNAQMSLRINVCKYWNKHKNITTKNLGEIFGIGKSTTLRYLNWGNQNGLCIYNGKEESIKNNERQNIYVNLIKENDEKWYDEPLSLSELSRITGINRGTLSNSLHNKKPLNGHCAKYDPKYIGSMVIIAEETE